VVVAVVDAVAGVLLGGAAAGVVLELSTAAAATTVAAVVSVLRFINPWPNTNRGLLSPVVDEDTGVPVLPPARGVPPKNALLGVLLPLLEVLFAAKAAANDAAMDGMVDGGGAIEGAYDADSVGRAAE
jgi:hypothetical protein